MIRTITRKGGSIEPTPKPGTPLKCSCGRICTAADCGYFRFDQAADGTALEFACPSCDKINSKWTGYDDAGKTVYAILTPLEGMPPIRGKFDVFVTPVSCVSGILEEYIEQPDALQYGLGFNVGMDLRAFSPEEFRVWCEEQGIDYEGR